MCSQKSRIYCLDNDTLVVNYKFDKEAQMFLGDYPDFSETPRFTPNGRPWRNAFYTECKYSSENYGDCGTCKFFIKENPQDIIGVCYNQALRKEQTL